VLSLNILYLILEPQRENPIVYVGQLTNLLPQTPTLLSGSQAWIPRIPSYIARVSEGNHSLKQLQLETEPLTAENKVLLGCAQYTLLLGLSEPASLRLHLAAHPTCHQTTIYVAALLRASSK
jgi:hypothetical protein